MWGPPHVVVVIIIIYYVNYIAFFKKTVHLHLQHFADALLQSNVEKCFVVSMNMLTLVQNVRQDTMSLKLIV